MPGIENINLVNQELSKLAARYAKPGDVTDPSVAVGYTAKYAVYVHEDLEANHPNGGQAKYLEQPAREKHEILANIVATAVKRGVSLVKALYLAGLRLQRESQELVPVDTGNLRGSAFTVIERGRE